MKYYLEKI